MISAPGFSDLTSRMISSSLALGTMSVLESAMISASSIWCLRR